MNIGHLESFNFSDDPNKNTLIANTLVRESDLMEEYQELDTKYSAWVLDSCVPDYNGDVTPEEASVWSNRMREIEKELASLLDGTGITKEEYEEAKKTVF